MRYATFNVLADAYTGYDDYSHVNPKLLKPGARLDYIVNQINSLEADVIGLQEADRDLVEAFEGDESWQALWLPKERNKPDGCLTLVSSKFAIADYEAHKYDDESGHIFQITRVGQLAVANTHIKWAPTNDVPHIGVSQTKQLLRTLRNHEPAVILADCNDRPGGPVQTLVHEAGFTNLSGDRPTAIVNQELVAIDLLAVWGVEGHLVNTDYNLVSIPNEACASDRIPVVADVDSIYKFHS